MTDKEQYEGLLRDLYTLGDELDGFSGLRYWDGRVKDAYVRLENFLKYSLENAGGPAVHDTIELAYGINYDRNLHKFYTD